MVPSICSLLISYYLVVGTAMPLHALNYFHIIFFQKNLVFISIMKNAHFDPQFIRKMVAMLVLVAILDFVNGLYSFILVNAVM